MHNLTMSFTILEVFSGYVSSAWDLEQTINETPAKPIKISSLVLN